MRAANSLKAATYSGRAAPGAWDAYRSSTSIIGKKREGRTGERFNHRANTAGSLAPGCRDSARASMARRSKLGALASITAKPAMKNFGPSDAQ